MAVRILANISYRGRQYCPAQKSRVTYRKLSSHLPLLPKVSIINLLTDDSSELQEHRQYLAMGQWIRKYIPQEQRAVLPNLVHSVVFQRIGVLHKKSNQFRICQVRGQGRQSVAIQGPRVGSTIDCVEHCRDGMLWFGAIQYI